MTPGYPTVPSLVLYLRENAPRYFTDLAGQPVKVKLVRARDLFSSSIYQFEMRAKQWYHSVVVKIPAGRRTIHRAARADSPDANGRPRVRPIPDPNSRFRDEHSALRAIQDHFEELDDPRFGAVRVLDILPATRAIIMECIREPKLSSLFLKANRLRYLLMSIKPEMAFLNAGAWLREFHRLEALEHSGIRHLYREDFINEIYRNAEFLAQTQGNERYFQSIASRAEAAAYAILPKKLPLAMGHGDYAPHNIFVDPMDRITVFDTQGKWQAPIYEDIAHFLTVFKMCTLQLYSQGLAFSPRVTARFENAFLNGYFGQDVIPLPAIRLYEIMLLLNKWPSGAYDQRAVFGVRKIARRCRLAITGPFLHRCLSRLLREVN